MKEEWKNIKEFNDYQISNLGNIRSLKKNNIRILKPCLNNNGYYYVSLYKKKRYTFSIHQLVAETFLNHKIYGHKIIVNHINFNKLDNRVKNLELITSRENSSNYIKINKTSKYVGVSKIKNKFLSQIRIKNFNIKIGFFDDEYIAHKSYLIAVENIEKFKISDNIKKDKKDFRLFIKSLL
jgi:hypothetical protein